MNKELFMEVAKFTQGLTKEDVAMKETVKETREEVGQEMSNFEMIAKFTQELTMEDVTMIETREEMERTEHVHNNTTTADVEYMEAEIVGIVGQDIEVGIAEEDRVDIGFYGTSYATEGIRYIERLEPLMTW